MTNTKSGTNKERKDKLNSTQLTNNTKNTKSTKTKLRILQININKSCETTSALLQHCKEKEIDILMIQEPNIRGGRVRGIPESIRKVYQGSNTKVVTAILNKDIQLLNMESINSENMTTIEITHKQKRIYIINLYIPPESNNREIFDSIMGKIETNINKFQKKNKNIIIGGDVNSKTREWGNAETDARGKNGWK